MSINDFEGDVMCVTPIEEEKEHVFFKKGDNDVNVSELLIKSNIDNIKQELLDKFGNNEKYRIYDSEDEEFVRNSCSLRIKFRHFPISLHISINIFQKLEIKTMIINGHSPLNNLTYRIDNENYLDKLEKYLDDVYEAFNKYKEFIQDIVNKFENDDRYDYLIESLVDLNQYYLYLQHTNHTHVVITPSFEIIDGKIYTIAYIGKCDSNYPSKIYVNSANMEDVYDTVEFFL